MTTNTDDTRSANDPSNTDNGNDPSNTRNTDNTRTTRYAHYVAHARGDLCPFADELVAHWVWRQLRKGFPDALAVTLMPDHLHMVAPDRGARGAKRLGRILGAANRIGATRARFRPVEPPRPLTSLDKLQRGVRYVWLNPCRPRKYRGRDHRLVDDPLAWWWSTLRDTVGAVADPWTPAADVATALGWSATPHIACRLHAYATRDDHVAPHARVFPEPAAASELPHGSIADVFAAALHATRSPREDLRRKTTARRVAVGLSYRQGWTFPRRLAPHLGVHPSTISRLAPAATPAELRAAARCLTPRLSSPSPAEVLAARGLL